MGQACCTPPADPRWVGTWVGYLPDGRVVTLVVRETGWYDVTEIGPCSVNRRRCCICYWRDDGFGCCSEASGFKVSSVSFAPEGGHRAVLNGIDFHRIGPCPAYLPQPAPEHTPPHGVPPSAQYMAATPGSPHAPKLLQPGGDAYPGVPR